MRDLFARASAYEQLTPAERAILRLLEGLVCAGLVAALPILASALGHTQVNWGDVARAALSAGAVAMLLALAKYARAHGDPMIAGRLDDLASTAAHVTSSPN